MTPHAGLLMLLPGPLMIVVFAVVTRRVPVLTRAAAFVMWAELVVSVVVCVPHLAGPMPPRLWHGFAIDQPAAILLMLTTGVAAASLTHSVVFFEKESTGPHPPSRRQISQFYFFIPLFLLAMYGVIAAQNLGYLWIAMEATTLLSAPLVYYYRTKTALEATWKYVIICSVGIAFAFFGTALIFAASQQVGALRGGSLLLPELQARIVLLPHGLLRLGFIFVLLGYGTKAGLFPLHNWLPDAHSEAPAPASAMLSGALLNCVLLAIWRIANLMVGAGEVRIVERTLLPMGLATVVASSLFLLNQRDLKRLLAYSSMENVGVMAVAIALRSPAGFLLQAINHSLVKTALFLLAGNLIQLYGVKTIRTIRGILFTYLGQGICLLAGFLAVAGAPPFGSFLSEWTILAAAADAGRVSTVLALSVGLATAFIALSIQFGAMLFGRRTPGDVPEIGLLEGSRSLLVVPAALVAVSLCLGLVLSPALVALLRGIAL